MNKTFVKIIGVSGALLPQFIFENYLLTTIALLIIGVGYSFIQDTKYLFRNLFLVELLLISIISFLLTERIAYLAESMQAVGMPSILLYAIFILFNAINVVVLTYLGYKIGQIAKSGYYAIVNN